MQHDGGGLLGYGRGFVTDDVIVWPTRDGLFFLDPDTAARRPPLRTLPAARSERLLRQRRLRRRRAGGRHADAGVGLRRRATAARPAAAGPRRRASGSTRSSTEAERQLADGRTGAGRGSLAREAARGDFPRAAARVGRGPAAALTADDRRRERSSRPTCATCSPRTARPSGSSRRTASRSRSTRCSTGTSAARRRRGSVRRRRCRPSGSRKTRRRSPPDADIDRTLKLPHAVGRRCAPIRRRDRPPQRAVRRRPRRTARRAARPTATTTRARRRGPASPTRPTSRDGFVAAGPHAVAVYAAGREPPWVFRVPDTDPLPARPAQFRVRTGERAADPAPVVVRARRVVAARPARRAPPDRPRPAGAARGVGARGATAGRGYEPLAVPATRRGSGRTSPCRAAGRRCNSPTAGGGSSGPTPGACDGRSRRAAGSATHDRAGVRGRTPPAEVGREPARRRRRAGAGAAAGPRDGRVKWTYDADGETSLTGDPPQVRAWGDALLVAVRRNHGVETRPRRPGRRASRRGPAARRSSTPIAIDLSARRRRRRPRLYIPAGNKLLALALNDGKTGVGGGPAGRARPAGGWCGPGGRA